MPTMMASAVAGACVDNGVASAKQRRCQNVPIQVGYHKHLRLGAKPVPLPCQFMQQLPAQVGTSVCFQL